MISPKSILEPVLPKTEEFREQKIRYLGILKNLVSQYNRIYLKQFRFGVLFASAPVTTKVTVFGIH